MIGEEIVFFYYLYIKLQGFMRLQIGQGFMRLQIVAIPNIGVLRANSPLI